MSDYYIKSLVVPLPLADADKIIEKALQLGRSNEMLPLTVAVLDMGGNLIALKREDGCGIMRSDIAIGKAWGALGMGISTRTIRDRLADRPSFQAALASVSNGRFIPVPGGVLICKSNNEVVGAVGVSGDASNRDEYCAIQAVLETGYLAHPEQPDENWSQASL
ncbi:GlcG/HbpS family heme-binding protein [Alginatibacterium sediminis]|uniref:GlcG/HbpS family heme-binding protein n=1 Tax=Alginatibacterium sediminis TaxID=2164068 RepID=UPI0018F59F2B|nr:heme-binding protein [Alginatibacterium sediminis]